MYRINEGIRFPKMRERMVQEQIVNRGVTSRAVIDAMLMIPRHLFVADYIQNRAYDDSPMPIAEQQTISQPYIVALMTELLDIDPSDKILEIGTGSGYQTAILSALAKKVFTVERHRTLAQSSRRLFDELGLHNVVSRTYDGTYGWREFAPFNKIIVTAASPCLPELYGEQLKEGGKIVIPVGSDVVQTMKVYTKVDGRLIENNSVECQFVKLLGEYGWKE